MFYTCFNCDAKFTTKDESLKHQMDLSCGSSVKKEVGYKLSCSASIHSDYGYKPPVSTNIKKERDRSRSPVKEQFSQNYILKNSKSRLSTEPRDWESSSQVKLDFYNSDLWLMIDENGYTAKPLSDAGFVFMWAGCKSTYGMAASSGRVYFEVRLSKKNDIDDCTLEDIKHILRCGWSSKEAGMVLGEEAFSYGFGGTGFISCKNEFKKYGIPFTVLDVIGCFIEWDKDGIPCISFSVNGKNYGKCYSDYSAIGKELFPHILTKNIEFEVNFGQRSPWFPPQQSGWQMIGDLAVKDRFRNFLPPEKHEDCTVIMMCGLPAAGKTFWANKYASEHPNNRFYHLGTNGIIERMRLEGLPRKGNYHGRWEMLIEKSTACLNMMLEIACKRKRNFIIDQTNVYPNAQQRKMAPFVNYQKVAVVVVPEHCEFERRQNLQITEGKFVPESAVMEMKANFTLPSNNLFDDIIYSELDKCAAEKLVHRYNMEGKEFKSFTAGPQRGRGGGGAPPQSNYEHKPQLSHNYEHKSHLDNNRSHNYHDQNSYKQNSRHSGYGESRNIQSHSNHGNMSRGYQGSHSQNNYYGYQQRGHRNNGNGYY